MSNQLSEFWSNFHNKNFTLAQEKLDALMPDEKQAVLAELFQKSECQRTPDMISVLHRELHDKRTFDDFYQSWLPPKRACNPIRQAGQIFEQFFPAPIRVMNAVNINNPKDILSVGLTWISNEEQGQQMWEAATANNQVNQERSDNIKSVSNKVSSELYKPKSDDNLGVPF